MTATPNPWLVACPVCNGAGVRANSNDPYGPMHVTCETCNGAGTMTQEEAAHALLTEDDPAPIDWAAKLQKAIRRARGEEPR